MVKTVKAPKAPKRKVGGLVVGLVNPDRSRPRLSADQGRIIHDVVAKLRARKPK